MRTARISAVCIVGGLLTGALAMADTFQTGDVFASINNGTVAWYRADGTFVQNMNDGSRSFTTGSASDATGLWVTDFGANGVSKWDPTGTTHTSFGGGYGTPEDVLVDASHNVFISSLGGGAGLKKFDSAGNLLASYNTGKRIDWFDLSADESTMFYTDEGGAIHRWDLTTNTGMSDLTSGGGQFALRLVGDGTILVASSGAVNRIRMSDGTIIQSYSGFGDAGGLFALNLDSNGTSFWTGDFNDGELFKLNIASGALEQTINTGVGGGNLFGVSVFGEECQAGCGGPPPPVPEPGSIFLLGTALIGVGTILRKRFA